MIRVSDVSIEQGCCSARFHCPRQPTSATLSEGVDSSSGTLARHSVDGIVQVEFEGDGCCGSPNPHSRFEFVEGVDFCRLVEVCEVLPHVVGASHIVGAVVTDQKGTGCVCMSQQIGWVPGHPSAIDLLYLRE